jgi:hypothetical protein
MGKKKEESDDKWPGERRRAEKSSEGSKPINVELLVVRVSP